MSDERFLHAVEPGQDPAQDNDVLAVVDRELREILSVEPSAGFTDRVRTAVRADQAGERSVRWWPLAAAAVVALVAGSVAFSLTGRRDQGTTSAPPSSVVAETAPRSPSPAKAPELPAAAPVVRWPGPAAASTFSGAASRSASNVDAESRTLEPEVLVDPRQRVALERLLALSRGLPESSEPQRAASDAGVEELQVPMVIVEPLDVPALPPGGGTELNIGWR